jgi:hypothetical protein
MHESVGGAGGPAARSPLSATLTTLRLMTAGITSGGMLIWV